MYSKPIFGQYRRNDDWATQESYRHQYSSEQGYVHEQTV